MTKDEEQMKFAFNSMIDAGSKITDIMFMAIFRDSPKKAEEIAELLKAENSRVILQVERTGIELFIVDGQKATGPVFSYLKEQEEKAATLN